MPKSSDVETNPDQKSSASSGLRLPGRVGDGPMRLTTWPSPPVVEEHHRKRRQDQGLPVYHLSHGFHNVHDLKYESPVNRHFFHYHDFRKPLALIPKTFPLFISVCLAETCLGCAECKNNFLTAESSIFLLSPAKFLNFRIRNYPVKQIELIKHTVLKSTIPHPLGKANKWIPTTGDLPG